MPQEQGEHRKIPARRERWCSVEEAAEVLGVSDDTIRRWCKSGELPGARRFGSTWRIPYSTVYPPDASEQHES